MLRSLKTKVSCIALAIAMSNAALAANSNLSVANAPSQPSIAASDSVQSAKANAKVTANAQEQTAEKRKQITAEAIMAVGETRNALKALDENKKDEALAALERTTGKLELILARDPKLALAPTNVSEVTTSVIADLPKIKEARARAEDLLAEGQVQAARHLLDALASETVIRVSNIPLGTYPDAIKQAAKLIDQGKQDEAKKVLQTALNTLVITDIIIPLPVEATQALLKDAEKLAEKQSRTVDENKQLNDLLTASRTQVEFAEALGYGTKQDFRGLYAQLDKISDKTTDGKAGTGFFAEIKSSLLSLLKANQTASNNRIEAAPQSPDKTSSNQGG